MKNYGVGILILLIHNHLGVSFMSSDAIKVEKQWEMCNGMRLCHFRGIRLLSKLVVLHNVNSVTS